MSVFTWLNSPLCNSGSEKARSSSCAEVWQPQAQSQGCEAKEDSENDLDVVEDSTETVDWLDGENEPIDANQTGFDIEEAVDLQSKTLHMLLANNSMQPLEKQKTTEKPVHKTSEMLGVVSWGFE
ncbi:hypothetical protein K439DRAFT_1548233 [Ramaria rubella]|nr:hypothetical protein K439DRAFT_1548233 [Ramaria rubella]